MIRRILAWLFPPPEPEPDWQYDWHTLTRKADGRTEQLVTTGWSEDWEPVENGEMMKIQIQFKDPDGIYEILNGRHPLPDDEQDITPRMEKEREDFSDEYFEYGDYGRIEVDTETMACRLLARKEWK